MVAAYKGEEIVIVTSDEVKLPNMDAKPLDERALPASDNTVAGDVEVLGMDRVVGYLQK